MISGIRVNGTTLDSSDSTGININENVIIDGNLNVTGTVDFADQNISNVGSLSLDSISGDADSNTSITFSGSDVITMATGGSTAATFNADQTTSFSGAVNITTTTTGASLLITTTEDSNSAAPVIELKRNSSSPADADYLGRLTFKGENDADQAVTYARISGKVLDASDGTEDGAIEFNTMKAGSATISARLNSDELKLLNGTTLDVDGSGTFAGSVTATSLTTNTISSNGSNADLSIQPSGTGDVLISALRVNGTTLDSSDSTKITLAEAVDVTGAASFGSTVSLDGSGDLITNDNRISYANAGTVSFLDFTVTQFGQNNNTVLSSVRSINLFLDSNGGDAGQAFRIFNNTNPDSSPTETTFIFKVDESGDTTIKGDLLATDITANSLTTNVITSNGSNADININASGSGDVVLSALRVNGTTLDSADSTKITVAEDVDVTGTLFSRGNVFGVQRLTGSGSTEVVNLTDTVTLLITTGSNQAFSLADGVEGQLKIISMVTDGGDGIVTPANFINGTRITFNDVEDTVVLLYQSTGWVCLARQNAIFS